MGLEWTEYISVAVSLAMSIFINVLVYRKYQKSDEDPRFSLLPVIASLIASSTSGVTLLGKPAEAYQFGINFQVFYSATLVVALASTYFFVPVVSKMTGPSIYEYFRLRFNSKIENMAIVQFILGKVFATALTSIPPALIVNHFSGISLSTTLIVLISLTTVYTMIGGLKGVVWTDTFQAVIILVSLIALAAACVVKVGGVSRVLELAYDADRLSWTFPSFDPTERLSFWAFLSGLNVGIIINQSWYQRIRALKTDSEIKLSVLFLPVGIGIIGFCSCFMGLAIFAHYRGCDPKEAMLIDSYSNIVVYWLDDVGGRVPGLRGLYIAGITCASISTMSTYLNTIATMIVDDFTRPGKTREVKIQIWTLLVGSVAIAVALLIRNAGSLVELTFVFISLDGITSGLFILGALFTPATGRGAVAGGATSLVAILSLIVGTKLFGPQGSVVHYQNKPMSIEACNNVSNLVKSNITERVINENNSLFIFKLSPFAYPFTALALTLTVGAASSLLMPPEQKSSTDDSRRNPDLYHPCVHQFLPKGPHSEPLRDENAAKKDDPEHLE